MDVFLNQLIQFYATNLHHQLHTVCRVAPQHENCNLTIDYCDVTSLYVYHVVSLSSKLSEEKVRVRNGSTVQAFRQNACVSDGQPTKLYAMLNIRKMQNDQNAAVVITHTPCSN